MSAKCPIHPILLQFITIIVFGRDYKLLNISLLNVLLTSETSPSITGPNIPFSTLLIKYLAYNVVLTCDPIRDARLEYPDNGTTYYTHHRKKDTTYYTCTDDSSDHAP
jgi:hypothetical protein